MSNLEVISKPTNTNPNYNPNADQNISNFVLLFIPCFIGSLILQRLKRQKDKQIIKEYLNNKGATNVIVEIRCEADASSDTYEVEYSDRLGMHCKTKCKITKSLSCSSEDILWYNPHSRKYRKH